MKVNRTNLLNEVKNRAVFEIPDVDFIKQKVKELMTRRMYPESIEPILVAYFERSAKIFGWNKGDFIKKINNLETNVEEFVIADIESVTVTGSLNEKKINFSKSILREPIINPNFANEILGEFFHEIRHATDETYRGYEFLENGMRLEGISVRCNDEMYVEGGAQLIKGAKYRGKQKISMVFEGYEDLSYGFSMLASALGMNEVELLKLGEKGYSKFTEKISKENKTYINNSKTLAELFTRTNEIAATFRFVLRDEKAETYADVYKIMQAIYNERMQNNPPKTEEDIIKAEYEQYKIYANIYQLIRTGANVKMFEEMSGVSVKEIKEKIKLSAEQEKKYSEIAGKVEEYSFDNRELKRPIKQVVREMVIQYKEDKRQKKNQKKNQQQQLPPAQGVRFGSRDAFAQDKKVTIIPKIPEMSVDGQPQHMSLDKEKQKEEEA